MACEARAELVDPALGFGNDPGPVDLSPLDPKVSAAELENDALAEAFSEL